jgi:hypothetical protein
MGRGFEGINEQTPFGMWPVPEGKAPSDKLDEKDRAELYRQNAQALRRLAAELRFDFCRREQLLALAAGFDRFADRLHQRASVAAHVWNSSWA